MNKIIKEIPINIKNQHQLLNLLSEGYKSLSKALMEYIDNSFDSAEDFFDDMEKQYRRNVIIDISIDRDKHKILLQDNCEGMSKEILEGLANSINESEKKRREQKRAWVNGQFGLGAHAFRFFAQQLLVTTKKRDACLLSILINRDKSVAQQVEIRCSPFDSVGTLVELSGVDKDQMKHLNAEELKKDIETYFEMLLRRNVQIKIFDGEKEYVCEPFDYNQVSGLEIKRIINIWKEGNVTVEVPTENGIKVNLKVCTESVRRPPFFSRKGRRINFISELHSFINKTEHRKKVWENFYLTGYIEMQNNLEPVATRDDFLSGRGHQQKRTGIYNEIVKLEDEIYSAIEMVNKDKSDKSLKDLASVLTDLLSEISKEKEIKLRYQDDGNLAKKKEKEKFFDDKLGDEIFNGPDGGGSGSGGPGSGGPGSGGPGNNGPGNGGPGNGGPGNGGPGGGGIGNEKEVKGFENPEGSKEGKKIEKQRQGIRIEFSILPSEERSHYGDGEIKIFTTHPDFEARKGSTQQAELGSMKITARLANYLAAVISSEFQEIFYKQKKLEPDRKAVLQEQIDFIFMFEEGMKSFIDQPLHSIGKLKK